METGPWRANILQQLQNRNRIEVYAYQDLIGQRTNHLINQKNQLET